MLPNVAVSLFALPAASVAREFADRTGGGWRVWWSATAHTSPHAHGFAIRPPGIWFEQLGTGCRRYLFHPGLDVTELARVPDAWLNEWLARADALPAATPAGQS